MKRRGQNIRRPVFESGMILAAFPNDIAIRTENFYSEAYRPVQEALENTFFGKPIEIV